MASCQASSIGNNSFPSMAYNEIVDAYVEIDIVHNITMSSYGCSVDNYRVFHKLPPRYFTTL